MKSFHLQLAAILLSIGAALARPVILPRQESSDTNYTGYIMEWCNDMFDSCKGHLVHPGHVPGGMKQCQFEYNKCTDSVKREAATTP
ncbi:hypothetical protein QBC35DRAFT_98113 [Podospora australis]|uniref:Uncharacterized protein n=1 Tax=Podospora australis TaxID=1536484 RepID=A0AAN6WK13_9PEZI|nr:hypothetical protein QBC35DRAFT_98113 [Podospora australis]